MADMREPDATAEVRVRIRTLPPRLLHLAEGSSQLCHGEASHPNGPADPLRFRVGISRGGERLFLFREGYLPIELVMSDLVNAWLLAAGVPSPLDPPARDDHTMTQGAVMSPTAARTAILATMSPHMLRFDRAYPGRLGRELQVWHAYVLDSGHSIFCLLAGQEDGGLIPAPVRSVLRGYTIREDGYVVADLPYDRQLGLLVPEDDEEL
jgi:hypothetical protein